MGNKTNACRIHFSFCGGVGVEVDFLKSGRLEVGEDGKVTLRRIFGEKFVRMGGGVIIPVENSSHGLLGCDTV
jgi:hypothetical protein